MKTDQNPRVKVICYYSHRKDGTPFTFVEKQTGANRRPVPIFDMEKVGGGKWRHREDLSVKKALRHIEKHEAHIINALIIVNNYIKETETTIGQYISGQGLQFNQPTYREDEKGCVYIKSITPLTRRDGSPMVDKMRTAKPYDPQKENRQNAVTDKSVGAAIDRLIGSAKFNVRLNGA